MLQLAKKELSNFILRRSSLILPFYSFRQALFHTTSARAYHIKPLELLKQKNDGWEKFSKWQPHTASFLIFAGEKVIYALALYLGGNLINDYWELDKQISEIENEVYNEFSQQKAQLNRLRSLQLQPNLYLMTPLKITDEKEYRETQQALDIGMQKLDSFDNNIEFTLKRRLENAYLLNKFSSLNKRIIHLKKEIQEEKNLLSISGTFNESIWLQKNKQYNLALKLIEHLTAKLEKDLKELKEKHSISPLENDHPLLVEENYQALLVASYNAQAKLYSCKAIVEDNKYRVNASSSYDQAIKILQEVKGANDHDLALLYSGKGYLLIKSNALEEALTFFEKASELKSKEVHVLSGLGLLYYKKAKKELKDKQMVQEEAELRKIDSSSQQNLDKAYGYFSRVTQLDDTNNVYVYRGNLLRLLGDNQSAEKDYDKALKLDSNHYKANINKAVLLAEKGQCEEAEGFYKKGLVSLVERPLLFKKYSSSDFKEQNFQNCSFSMSNFWHSSKKITPK